MTSVVLGALALGFAGPVPAWLARVHRLHDTPRAALVLWQCVALSAVLSALGAGLALATAPAWQPVAASYAVAGAALLLTGLVLGRLLLSGHRLGTRIRRLRREHRRRVDLLGLRDAGPPDSDPLGGERAGVGEAADPVMRVLEHPLPVAYCLPGMTQRRIVVTTGALAGLSAPQVRALLAHERAHLRERHDLVLEAFGVLHDAFPRLVSSGAALAEVRLLVEVIADRAAVRAEGAAALTGALVTVAGSRVQEGAGALTGPDGPGQLAERVRVLVDGARRPGQVVVVGGLGAALVVLPTVLVVLPWLSGLVS